MFVAADFESSVVIAAAFEVDGYGAYLPKSKPGGSNSPVVIIGLLNKNAYLKAMV